MEVILHIPARAPWTQLYQLDTALIGRDVEKCYLCTPIIIKRTDVESSCLSSRGAARLP